MGELEDKYLSLKRVLTDAMMQAKAGKGKERHADDEPFQYQKICVINRWLEGSPVAGALFQAVKKTVESSRLSDSAAIHELRGAINYLAAAIILLEERPEEKAEKEPMWGHSILDAHLPFLERETERLSKVSVPPLATTTGIKLCVSCINAVTQIDEVPCSKCFPWEFRPHFRLDRDWQY